MAIYKGMSLRVSALALATVFLLFVSMEAGQVQADSCNTQGIMNALGSCLSLTTLPAPGSTCCNSFNYVKDTIKPTDSCICSVVASVGVSAGEIKAVITACVGAYAAPACLG